MLWFYITATLLLLVSSILSKYGFDNNWTYNLLFLLTIIILSYYFQAVLVSRIKKVIVKWLCIVNAVVFLQFVVLGGNFFGVYNSEVYALIFLCIVLYAMLYIHQLMKSVTEESILINFDFWLISSYLIYFFGGFFVVLFYKNSSVDQRAFVWSLLNFTLFISVTIALIGHVIVRRQQKSAICKP